MGPGPGSQPHQRPGRVADAAIVTISDEDMVAVADPVSVVHRLVGTGRTVAVAESLTGGLVLAALTSVPGASAVVRGGVVAYAEELKTELLGVEPELLRRESAVSQGVALQMARGCRALMGASFGLSTTGEAGPDSASGRPVGTFFVAVSGPQGDAVSRSVAVGGRAQVREAAVRAAVALLRQTMSDGAAGAGAEADRDGPPAAAGRASAGTGDSGRAPDLAVPQASRVAGHGNTRASS